MIGAAEVFVQDRKENARYGSCFRRVADSRDEHNWFKSSQDRNLNKGEAIVVT